jgi:hypothetical protein
MAGHKRGEAYFVPRTLIPLGPHGIDWCCDLLLPKLQRWRREARSIQGDKSTCCQKFLNHLIPYFVEVLVQDGVYFIKEFPNHEVSHLLKVSVLYVFLRLSNYLLTVLF